MSSTQVVMPEDKVLTISVPVDVHANLLKAQCQLNINRIKNNRRKKISLNATMIHCLRDYFKAEDDGNA